nr:ribonuclease H-like domain-containing protein [Tanacetum cinerariifolium]
MKPHNKTPRELFLGRKHALSFMRPFGCPVIILNAIDHLGKFDGKADEGFFVGYSTNRKAFRVLNDALTRSMNYKPVITGNQSNGSAGTKVCDNIGKTRVETVLGKDYILLLLWTQDPPFSSSSKDSLGAGFKLSGEEEKKDALSFDNDVDENIVYGCADGLNIPDLEEIGRYGDAEDDDSGADMNNLDIYFQVSPVPTTRIHKDHPLNQVIKDLHSATQTRQMKNNLEEYGFPKSQDTKKTQPSGPTTNVEDEAFNEENVSEHSNDPLHSGENRIKLKELIEICTNLHNRVFDLENTKTAQTQEIDSLKRRVKKLEMRQK